VVEEEALDDEGEVVAAFVLVEVEVPFVDEVDKTDEEPLLDTPQVPEAG
jgi:hypothetical protein